VSALQAGELEEVKAGVHVVLGVLAAVCTAYNAAAWLYRRESHLAVNAVAYGLLTALEVAQVDRHRGQLG
jgi:hypothetical protein